MTSEPKPDAATTVDAQRREPLSRDRVLSAALELVDEQGLEALTMRRLASALGVEAMSLYNHVENKDDLYDGLIDLMRDEMTLPPVDGGEWKPLLRATLIEANRVMSLHSRAASLWNRFPGRYAQLDLLEHFSTLLIRGGFSASAAHHVWHVVASYLIGYAMTYGADSASAPANSMSRFRERVDGLAEDAPLMQVRQFMAGCDPDESFRVGVDVIIDGLERLLEGERAAAR